MQVQFRKIRDTLSPDLRRLYRNVRDKRGIHQAMGLAVVSIAKRSFNDPSLRPKPWPAKKDGSPSRLRDTGTLAKSIRVTQVSDRGVTVGSDRPYAAAHQLGLKTPAHTIRPVNKQALKFQIGGRVIFAKKVDHPGAKMPERPFLPFGSDGRPTPPALQRIDEVVRKKLLRGVR